MNHNGADQSADMEEGDMEAEEFYTTLDDDRRAELDEMLSAKVLGVEMYEDSLGDEEGEEVVPEKREFSDFDLFLDNDLALELYVASVYADPEGDPLVGMDAMYEAVGRLADENLELLDFDQADEEGGLYLSFGRGEKVEMVVVASAWMISEWEPEEDEDEDFDEDELAAV